MIQKAKLDLLENLPDIEIIDAPVVVDESPLVIPPGSQERWAFNKLLFIGAPVLVVLIILSAGVWLVLSKFVLSANKGKVVAPISIIEKTEVSAAPIAEPIKMNTVYFKDFLIDLKDAKGKSKILLCDVAFDLSEDKNTADLETRTDLRNMIYNTAKGKSIGSLKSTDDRKKFKKELADEMIKILGDGVVKNVYFTNYVIM
jgi:flagellar basal body-associated protein FliL